jgi:hypothetical protein
MEECHVGAEMPIVAKSPQTAAFSSTMSFSNAHFFARERSPLSPWGDGRVADWRNAAQAN